MDHNSMHISSRDYLPQILYWTFLNETRSSAKLVTPDFQKTVAQ